MKKLDIIASLVLGEITAIFAVFVLQELNFNLFPLAVLFAALPVLALLGVYLANIIGRKIPIIFQFAKYAVVGVANTAVDFGVLNVLMFLTSTSKGEKIIILNSVAFLVAVVNSYLWNKFWTFKFSGKENPAVQFLQFLIVSLIAILINGAIVYIISSKINPTFGLSDVAWTNIAKVVATAVSLIWNFIGYKFIVFNKKNGGISDIQKI